MKLTVRALLVVLIGVVLFSLGVTPAVCSEEFCAVFCPYKCAMNKNEPCRDKAVNSPSHTLDLLCHPDPFEICSHRYKGLYSHLGSHSYFKTCPFAEQPDPHGQKFPGLLLII